MRVALLTNFVAPYRVPVFRALRQRVGELRILASTAMEKNRQWQPDWGDLDVVVQRNLSFRTIWKHERFNEPHELHVPYDTIMQLRRYRPDVIISGEFGLRTVQAIAYAEVARVPLIIWATLTEHLEISRSRARQVLRRGLVRMADRIVVNGASGARYIRSLGAAPRTIVTIPQTTELRPFNEIPLERAAEAGRTLLCVGMISQLKGSDLLLQGLALWARQHPDESVDLIMVGEGPLRSSLQRVELPANARVEWAGAVPYHELPGWYARAGMLIFTTQGDEWGLVVNEAMAAGLPVIGSEYSQAVDELVQDGRNGWRFRPDSAQDIAAAIARALATPADTLHSMRAAARATSARITPDSVADQFAAVARELVAK
jgi:glycosyltransferase involved in cell wall biosynthesis